MSEIGFYFEKFQTNEDPEPQLSNKVKQFSTCHAEVFTCLGDGHNGPAEFQRIAREYCKDAAAEMSMPFYLRWVIFYIGR